jgi:hypothetical protein
MTEYVQVVTIVDSAQEAAAVTAPIARNFGRALAAMKATTP